MEIALFCMNLISLKYIYLQEECQVILHSWGEVTGDAVRSINSYKQLLGCKMLPVVLIIFSFTSSGQFTYFAFQGWKPKNKLCAQNQCKWL